VGMEGTSPPLQIPGSTGVPRILQWRGSHGRGQARESGDGSPPVGSRDKALVRSLGDEVPQKPLSNM